MKLLLLFIFFIPHVVYSQSASKESYLILRLTEHDDRTNKRNFFSIDADKFNTYGNDVYALVPFNEEPYKINSGISFYFQKTDSSQFFYNYFRSHSEALQFVNEKNWQLITVCPEINTELETSFLNGNRVPLPAVSSKMVYYFRKLVVQ